MYHCITWCNSKCWWSRWIPKRIALFWSNELIAAQMHDMGNRWQQPQCLFGWCHGRVLLGVDRPNMGVRVWPFGFGPLQVKRYNRSLCLSCGKLAIAGIGNNLTNYCKWKSRCVFLFSMIADSLVYFTQLFLQFNFKTGGLRATNHKIHNLRQPLTFLQPHHVHATSLLLSLQEYFQMIRLQTASRAFSKSLWFCRTWKDTFRTVSSVFALENQ